MFICCDNGFTVTFVSFGRLIKKQLPARPESGRKKIYPGRAGPNRPVCHLSSLKSFFNTHVFERVHSRNVLGWAVGKVNEMCVSFEKRLFSLNSTDQCKALLTCSIATAVLHSNDVTYEFLL